MPGAAAVGGLEESATGAVELVIIFPRALADFPHRGVNNIGIRGINHNVRATGIFVLGNNSLPGLTAVGGAVDSARFAGPVRMAEDSGKNAIRVARIDGERRDLLSVDQAEMSPCLPGINRFVDAIPYGQVGAMQSLTATHIDDVDRKSTRLNSSHL